MKKNNNYKDTEDLDLSFDLSSLITPPNVSSNENNDKLGLYEQSKKLQNERYQKDTNWRSILAKWVMIITSWWLFFVGITLSKNKIIGLSDPVLITLLGTTTVNVLGLAFIVLKGLFK